MYIIYMKTYTYYVYHIPGIKIGCTEMKPADRVKAQGYSEFEILETHTDIYIASDREIELQIQYNYKRDNPLPYYKTVNIATTNGRSKGGKTRTKDLLHQSSAGKIGGSIGGKISGKINANRVSTCPYCNVTMKGLNYSRWHGDNCKHKKG
jgi:hypothetical protein